MSISIRSPRTRLLIALLASCVASSCDAFKSTPVQVNGSAATKFSVASGREIDVFMQTIGPGSYAVPPALDGSTIAFLEVTPGEEDPGGATQIFHFRAGEPGMTVITFTRLIETEPAVPQNAYTVVDTVVVR